MKQFTKILPILLLLFSTSFYAQNHNQKKEKIKSLKIAFITNELDLTATEAAAFWPVYNSYDEKQYTLRRDKSRTFRDKIQKAATDKITDKEALAILKSMEDIDDKLYSLRKKMNSDLSEILSPVKIVRLKKAEEDFNHNLLRQYRNKKSD